MSSSRQQRVVLIAALAFGFAANVLAQGRTDVVSLANGDRITGEVMRLERGRLEFKTDDAGTLYLEWDKLASVVATALGIDFDVRGPADDPTVSYRSMKGFFGLFR